MPRKIVSKSQISCIYILSCVADMYPDTFKMIRILISSVTLPHSLSLLKQRKSDQYIMFLLSVYIIPTLQKQTQNN